MNTRKLVGAAIFSALGVIIPLMFHFIGPNLGRVFLPMHLPVLLAGFTFGPLIGLIVGLLTPVLSSFLTGMPPLIPMLPIMVIELGIYGLVVGYFYYLHRLSIYPSLIIGLLAGRIGGGIMVWILVNIFSIAKLPANPLLFIKGSLLTGAPGIVVQLLLIPLLVKYLRNYQLT